MIHTSLYIRFSFEMLCILTEEVLAHLQNVECWIKKIMHMLFNALDSNIGIYAFALHSSKSLD